MPRARERVSESSLPNGDIRPLARTAPPTRLSQAPGTMLTYGYQTPGNGRPLQPAAPLAYATEAAGGKDPRAQIPASRSSCRGVRAFALDANSIPLAGAPTSIGTSLRGLSRSFPWCCRQRHRPFTTPAVSPSPVPATSNGAGGFPALRSPVRFTPRVMRPIPLAVLSAAGSPGSR